jgi:uncharacterized protein (DUF2062 family)
VSRVARALKQLLQIEDTPHRIAHAFGIGVWIAFFPIWGIHTLMALGLAFLLRLSRAAMVIGAWVNNPWTALPFYAAGTVLGCWMVGMPVADSFQLEWGALRPYLLPFVLGNTVVGVIGGLLGYFGVRFVLERRRAQPSGGSAS